MSRSSIPYVDETLPVVTGCTGVGDNGFALPCRARCWARNLANRFNQKGTPAGNFEPVFHLEVLPRVLHWRRPRRVAVSFTGDLFDRAITDEKIAAVFGYMACAPKHTFLVLTKQAKRMSRWFEWVRTREWRYAKSPVVTPHPWYVCHKEATGLYLDTALIDTRIDPPYPWPLPNVHVGVSVSCQQEANDRIPRLLECPAAVHWVSWEPVLGPVDFKPWIDRLGWIVCAAETGPGARPMDLDWVRRTRDCCADAGVKFMLKNQVGFVRLDGRIHATLGEKP